MIVAELSANHLGSLSRARALVDCAAAAGADAIKLQTFTPEQMAPPGIRLTDGPWAGRELQDLYREAHTPREWHAELFDRARELGMVAFSSVFHPDDVEFLELLDCPIYKIASFELTDHSLIRYAAATGKPLIISTGMATAADIEEAARAAGGCRDMTWLKCTSSYPAPVSEANLLAGPALGPKWGLSDHTLSIVPPVVAVALGASVIEKHITLSRADGGPDAGFSLEPSEFAAMVKACREAREALGSVRYGPTPAEEAGLFLRRSSGGRRGA